MIVWIVLVFDVMLTQLAKNILWTCLFQYSLGSSVANSGPVFGIDVEMINRASIDHIWSYLMRLKTFIFWVCTLSILVETDFSEKCSLIRFSQTNFIEFLDVIDQAE